VRGDARGRPDPHRDRRRRAADRRQRPVVPDAEQIPAARRPHRPAGAPARGSRRRRGDRCHAAVRLLRAVRAQPHHARRRELDRPPVHRPRRTGAIGVVDIAITGPGETDTTLRSVIHNSTVKPGTRLEHTAYERLKLELLRSAQERGYLDANLERHELLVDPEARTADVHVALATGGRYQFGKILIEQNAISDRLFAGYLRFAEGQPYSPERVRSTQFALEDSNYFSTISVLPGDRDPVTLTVPVTVRGEPIKRDRYSVSAGYGTDTGVRGKFTWDNRRINRNGHRSQIQLTASSIQSEAIARYIIPVGDPSLEKLEFSTGYTREEIGDLESERVEVIGSITEAMGSWQRVLFLKLNEERSIFADGTDQTDLLLIPG
jgi:translocation and assembly module TamA